MTPILLLVIAIMLIVINIMFDHKSNTFSNYINKNDLNGKSFVNENFQKKLKNETQDLSDSKIQIGQIRKDVAESLTELQKDIMAISSRIDVLEGRDKEVQNINTEYTKSSESNKTKKLNVKEEDVINDISLDSKTVRIKKLLLSGASDEEICEKLSVGKGEVLLVKGLYKK